MLVYSSKEADLFIAKHFPNATNKPEIKEYFIWVWNDSNYQNAKVLTLHTFKPQN